MPTLTGNPDAGFSTVKLDLKENKDLSYEIKIEKGLISRLHQDLLPRQLGHKYAIITDSNVSGLYGSRLEQHLRKEGVESKMFVFKAGEQNKRLMVCADIIDQMGASGFGRDSVVIALGGGVSGDMGGLIAGLYCRGVPYVQVPTTLVAQADSAIGGKTGVDTTSAKNLVGLFKQPKVVYMDLETLKTLDGIQYVCGLAETVKHGIIRDVGFFNYLNGYKGEILDLGFGGTLEHITETNCMIKGEVVEKDPEEKGLRRILNLGHTVGHAIEKLSGFKLLHGQCVSIGIMVALRIANEVTGFPKEEIMQVGRLLDTFQLPITVPDSMDNEDIIGATLLDKKAAKGQARYCLPVRIGKMAEFGGQYATPVDNEVVRRALDASRNLPGLSARASLLARSG